MTEGLVEVTGHGLRRPVVACGGRRSSLLRWETGELAPAMGPRWKTGPVLDEHAGYGGQALRDRDTVLLRGTPQAGRCLRWETARDAGARQGCFLPVIDDGRVIAILEYYSPQRAAVLRWPAREKWRAIRRIARPRAERPRSPRPP